MTKSECILLHEFSTNDDCTCRFDYYLIPLIEEWRTPSRRAYSILITESNGDCITDHAFFYDLGEEIAPLASFLLRMAKGGVTISEAEAVLTDFLCERW